MKLNIFKRKEKKESAARKTIVVNPGQPVWTPRDYKSFAVEAYQRNVVAYRAINIIGDAVASIEWTAWRDDKEIESPLLELLQRPNPMQSGAELLRAKVGYLLISGNSYDERLSVGKEPKELYTLRPDRMKVIESDRGIPAAYEYKVGGRRQKWDIDINTLDCDIRHLKLFNPVNDWYGQSPVEAGAYAIDQHNEGMQWIQSLLQNSAIPSGILSMPVNTDLTKEQINELQVEVEQFYTGGKNAGRPMLLTGGLEFKPNALSPNDMGIVGIKSSAARDTALSFGVPPQLLGIPGDNTYTNYKEARLALWEDTVIPLLGLFAEDWTQWLGTYDNVTLKPNLDKVPAIVDKKRTLWEMADKSTDLTINERREMKGFEPLPDGDVREKVTQELEPDLIKTIAYGS